MSILEYERHRAVHEFERFKYIIKSFLQAIEDSDDDFEVNYSMEVSGLVMKKAAEIYPLYELSTGYKALLSMIMELAYRSVLLNPSLETDNPGQTGIVIIDEIDAHLHPKWQWRIIDALNKCFPNIQFIIATHSPIVIASAKNARLIDLGQPEQVSYPQAVYGKDINAILQSVFATTDRDNYVAQLFARYSKLLEENETEASQVLDILEKTQESASNPHL